MMLKNSLKLFRNFPKPLWGDWLIIVSSLCLIVWMFTHLWSNETAATLRIRLSGQVYGTYSLQQNTTLHIHGKIGEAIVEINQGKVRFKQAPCSSQYCVHQGWLSKAGQTAICLPNQLSLELLGAKKNYDTLNY
jgi:hypothetical protein